MVYRRPERKGGLADDQIVLLGFAVAGVAVILLMWVQIFGGSGGLTG